MLTDVRFGSIASFLAHPSEVRFTPNSDRTADIRKATLSAKTCREQVQLTASIFLIGALVMPN